MNNTKYNILDEINTKHFYVVNVNYLTDDLVDFDEIFPTIEDCDKFIETLNLDGSIAVRICEYNLSDEEFDSLGKSVVGFFDNIHEFKYELIDCFVIK